MVPPPEPLPPLPLPSILVLRHHPWLLTNRASFRYFPMSGPRSAPTSPMTRPSSPFSPYSPATMPSSPTHSGLLTQPNEGHDAEDALTQPHMETMSQSVEKLEQPTPKEEVPICVSIPLRPFQGAGLFDHHEPWTDQVTALDGLEPWLPGPQTLMIFLEAMRSSNPSMT